MQMLAVHWLHWQCQAVKHQSTLSETCARLLKTNKKTKILHVGEGQHQLKIGKLMEVGIRRYYLWYQVAQIQGIFRKLIILTSAPGKRNEWNNNFWGDTFQLPSFLTSHGFLFSPSGNFGGRSCTQVGEVNPRDPITETENGNGS